MVTKTVKSNLKLFKILESMNKLLTTITLLCFSFVANADIYSCTTMNGGGIYTDNEITITPGRTFIIDANQGFRLPGWPMYIGDCVKGLIAAWSCSSTFEDAKDEIHRVDISEKTNPPKFAATITNGSYSIAEVGTCIKI